MNNYETETQRKNIAWFLPRPRLAGIKDANIGGMPLYAEQWLLQLARDILNGYAPKILNLFCGMNEEGVRVDIRPEVNPDIVCDAHKLTGYLQDKFDIILADPPYSDEEAEQLYKTPKLNYKKWTEEATKLLNPNGLLIVYHKYIMPNPNPEIYTVVKRVFIGHRTYHLPRVAIYFQKRGEK